MNNITNWKICCL